MAGQDRSPRPRFSRPIDRRRIGFLLTSGALVVGLAGWGNAEGAAGRPITPARVTEPIAGPTLQIGPFPGPNTATPTATASATPAALFMTIAAAATGTITTSPTVAAGLVHLPVVLKANVVGPTSTATATPTATASATPTATSQTGPAWLSYFNSLRALANLAPAIESAAFSDGCAQHARYMVKNDTVGHDETPGNPYYTPEGAAAGPNSNVGVHSNINETDESKISDWMTGPFHGSAMIDPKLRVTGFGSYREADGGWQMAGCLDVIRGRAGDPSPNPYPLKWPAEGKVLTLRSHRGNEYPDPLTSCPGYSVPSGPPIYLLAGPGFTSTRVTAHSFKQGSTNLDHCVIDSNTYTNSDAIAQSAGRSVLHARDVVVLMPKTPLAPGLAYTVSLTVNDVTLTWTFTAG